MSVLAHLSAQLEDAVQGDSPVFPFRLPSTLIEGGLPRQATAAALNDDVWLRGGRSDPRWNGGVTEVNSAFLRVGAATFAGLEGSSLSR